MEVSDREGGVLLRLTGRLDASAVPAVEKALMQAVNDSDGTVTVDCREVGFIGSSGLRVLLVAAKAMKARGRILRLVAVQEEVHHVVSLAGMQSFFEMTTAAGET